MKRDSDPQPDEMLPEHDFSDKQGERGKYHQAYQQGHTVRVTNEDGIVTIIRYELEDGAVLLDPDVRKYFPDSQSVNRAIRRIIELFPDDLR